MWVKPNPSCTLFFPPDRFGASIPEQNKTRINIPNRFFIISKVLRAINCLWGWNWVFRCADAYRDSSMATWWPQGSHSFWHRVLPRLPIRARCTKHVENDMVNTKPPGNMLAPRMAGTRIGWQCPNLAPLVRCICHQIQVPWIWKYWRCFTYCKEFGANPGDQVWLRTYIFLPQYFFLFVVKIAWI